MATRMTQLYVWSSPTEMIDCQYGRISIKEWLGKEKERINADPTRTAEIRKQGKRIGLFVDKVCEEVEGEE